MPPVITEYATIGDVARQANAAITSARLIAHQKGYVVGRVGNYGLIRTEDVPALVAEIKSRQRPAKQSA